MMDPDEGAGATTPALSAARLPDLSGRTALITGAGRGIGLAHAQVLSAAGAAVVVNDVGCATDGSGVSRDVAVGAAEAIIADGGRAAASTSDISTPQGAAEAVACAVSEFGGIDIVVNNAGIVGGGPIEDLDWQLLERMFDVHVIGSLGTIRAALPHMRRRGWGRVINTVSEVAFAPTEGGGVGYGAMKAAVWSATLSLAKECEGSGITVNGLSPGALTRMSAGVVAAGPSRDLDIAPLHVARTAALLLHDSAADINGRIIHVAGRHLREYLPMRRERDTALVGRLMEQLG